jgi:hypothetical protein
VDNPVSISWHGLLDRGNADRVERGQYIVSTVINEIKKDKGKWFASNANRQVYDIICLASNVSELTLFTNSHAFSPRLEIDIHQIKMSMPQICRMTWHIQGEDGHILPALLAATPETAVRPFQGWRLTGRRVVGHDTLGSPWIPHATWALYASNTNRHALNRNEHA